MPDGQNPDYNDDEDEMNSQFPGQSQFNSQSNPTLPPSSGQMPRKAIPRKSTAKPVSFSDDPESAQDLDYGVHEEKGEGDYQKYAPTPSRNSLRKRQSSESAPSSGGGGGGTNPLQEVLFQIASLMPGMSMRMEDRSKTKTFETDNSFRAPEFKPGSGARPKAQDDNSPGALHRKSALNDIAGREEYGGGGDSRRSMRDSGGGKPSALASFMDKLFSGSGDAAPVQEVEAPETKRKKALIRFGIMTACVVVLLLVYNVMPRKTQAYDSLPREFQSAEHEKSFKIVDASTAVYAIGPDTVRAPIKFFMNDWRDFVDVVLASPFQKQVWLLKTDQGIKDLTSNFELFEQRSPESVLAGETTREAERVTAYFDRNHSYPATAEAIGKYLNPFTEKEELPQLHQITEGNTKSGDDVDQKKLELYKDLVFAKAKIESKAAPGTISCWNVKFVSAHQNLNVFVIKPYGKEGKAIYGGHPEAQFLIALENGKPKELISSKPLFEWIGKSGIRPVTTVLFAAPIDPILLFALKHCAKLIFTILAFGSLGFLLSLPKGESPLFWSIILILTGVPAILADLSNWIP
jgi:hypothetical protein